MTNRELLMMLDGDLGERAVKNCIEYCGEKTAYYFLDKAGCVGGISVVLNNAFYWECTKEGADFWCDVYDELKKIGL